MRDNVKHLLQLLTERLDLPAPVLEVGALQTEEQEAYADMRPFLGQRPYLGCDMRPGPGVDCLADAHRLPFGDGTIGTLLMLDTLEHLHSPFVAVEEARRVVREGGIIVLASVMNFPIHSYPSDYWRFTPAAFDYLLQPLPSRFVLSQGDAEFPHTVIAVAMKAALASIESEPFRTAVQEIVSDWPEMMYGGPFLVWRPSVVAIAQRADDRLLPSLERGRTIAQSFVCPSSSLSRIDVKMSNLGRVNFSHLVFRLYRDEEPQQEIATYRLYAPHIVDKAWTFVPIPCQVDSAGRRYLLTLESPDAAPGQAVAAFASTETAYREGQLIIDGEPAEGSLCFQVHCRPSEEAVPMPRLESLEQVESRARDARAGAAPSQPNADELAALMLRVEEQRWEQVRHLASVIGSGFDGLHAEFKAVQERLEELKQLQRQALEQSTEAAAVARAVKRNPLYRLWRRIFH